MARCCQPQSTLRHPSIVSHSIRLSCKEYLADGRMDNPEYIYTEDHGPWRYLVMPAGCSTSDWHAPNKVDKAEASLFITLLRLPPTRDQHEAFLTAYGIIRDGHFSWSRFSGYWERYAVVRVDTRLVEACKSAPHLWAQAVVDATA